MSYDCMPMEELAGSDWFVWSDHEWHVLAKLPREVEDAGSYSVNFHVIPRHAFSPKSPFWPRNSWLPSLSPQILEPCESASLQERNMISITSAYCLRCLAYESTVLNGPAYSHGLLQQRMDLELGKCEGIYMPHMSSFWILPWAKVRVFYQEPICKQNAFPEAPWHCDEIQTSIWEAGHTWIARIIYNTFFISALDWLSLANVTCSCAVSLFWGGFTNHYEE